MEVTTLFLEHELSLRAQWVGGELNVLCTGGSRPHLGGCAMAEPYERPSGAAAAVSGLSAPGHQDAVLAGAVAKQLCKRLGCRVFVQCGIHYDDLTAQQLAELQARVMELCARLEVRL